MGNLVQIAYGVGLISMLSAIYGLTTIHKQNVKFEDPDAPTAKNVRSFEHTGATLTLVNGFQTWGEKSAISLTWNGEESSTNKDVEEVLVPNSSNDIAVSRHWNDTMPRWISIKNKGESPVCLAGVSIQIADVDWILSGDLGRVCGADYYESSRYVLPEDQHTQAPSCTWVEADHPIRFNLTSDGSEADYKITDPTDLCKPPFMTWAPDNSAGAEKRQVAGGSPFEGTLIKSSRLISSAVRLCNSATSRGPSFVSLPEGLFCDMTTRNLYPVCAEETEDVCFDLDEDELVKKKKPVAISQRGIDSGATRLEKVRVIQTFKKVDMWS
ncbi:hypothetical protein RBB50_008891 [Rhinocladiella similis]